MCWPVRSQGSGSKGVNFQIESNNNNLLNAMVLEEVGWMVAGRARVCVEGERWALLEEEQTYTFEVQGISQLFGTAASASFTFVLSSSSSSRSITRSTTSHSSRQMSSCDPSLWDESPSSLYGIQTFPSGKFFKKKKKKKN